MVMIQAELQLKPVMGAGGSLPAIGGGGNSEKLLERLSQDMADMARIAKKPSAIFGGSGGVGLGTVVAAEIAGALITALTSATFAAGLGTAIVGALVGAGLVGATVFAGTQISNALDAIDEVKATIEKYSVLTKPPIDPSNVVGQVKDYFGQNPNASAADTAGFIDYSAQGGGLSLDQWMKQEQGMERLKFIQEDLVRLSEDGYTAEEKKTVKLYEQEVSALKSNSIAESQWSVWSASLDVLSDIIKVTDSRLETEKSITAEMQKQLNIQGSFRSTGKNKNGEQTGSATIGDDTFTGKVVQTNALNGGKKTFIGVRSVG